MVRKIVLRLEQLEDRVTPSTTGIPWPDASHLTISFVPDNTQLASAEGSGHQDPLNNTNVSPGAAATTSHLAHDFSNAGVSTSAWQTAILRAFQTWSSVTNINFSVVADNGAPLGTPGALQGDPRFGDIRIADAPLTIDATNSSVTQQNASEIASAVPFTAQAGTWAGDLILNSNIFTPNNNLGNHPGQVGNPGSFSVNGISTGPGTSYDLYSVALHEVGHVLGLGDSTDSSSVMYAYYNGTRTGLSASDVTSIQNLYGARQPDRFENDFDSDGDQETGNTSFCTATPFQVAALQQYVANVSTQEDASGINSVPKLSVQGNLVSNQDVDYYSYLTTLFSSGFSVNLQTANDSLLSAKLTVYDVFGNPVGTQTTDPVNGSSAAVRVNAWFGALYYFKVESATGDPINTGTYHLQVIPDSSEPLAPFNLVQSVYTNNLPQNFNQASATPLLPTAQSTPGNPDFFTLGNLPSGSSVRYFSVQAPNAAGQTMNVTVSGLDGANSLNPTVTVYNSLGTVVPSTILASDNFTTTLQASNLTAGGTYYFAVGAANPTGTNATGHFSLGVEFNVPTIPPSSTAQTFSGSITGTMSPLTVTTTTGITRYYQQSFESLEFPQTQVVDLRVSFTVPNPTEQTALEVTLFDPHGNVVFDQKLAPGQTVTLNQMLAAGNYTFRFVGGGVNDHTPPNSSLPTLNYQINVLGLTDPLGPQLIDPNSVPTRDAIALLSSLVTNPIYGLIDPIAQQIFLADFFATGGS